MMDLKGLGDLASILDAPPANNGLPTMFKLDCIHEDKNVRGKDNKGFSQESIAELAESFEQDGMISPISLRSYPDRPGHFIINHGHRRYHTAIYKRWDEVPGFLDEKFSDFAQVVENVQREDLSAREIADFIGGKINQGMSQTAIAKRLGKSKAWVSQYASMLNLPLSVAAAVATGHVSDVTLANELAVAHRENPQAVEALLQAPEQKPTRAQVKAIRRPPEHNVNASGTRTDEAREPTLEMSTGHPIIDQATTHLILKKSSDEHSPSDHGAKLRPSDPAITALASAEFQRRREQREQEQKANADPALRQAGLAALTRLIDIARRDTGQSKRVADFLLAWWNASQCGGFDLTDIWSVDAEIFDDMFAVIAFIRRTRSYPDALSTPIHEAFKDLVNSWHPQLVQS